MTIYRSSIAPQLVRAETNIRRFVRAALNQGGRTFRATLIRERLTATSGKGSGGQGKPLHRKTGRTIRSIRYRLVETGGQMRLEASIGQGSSAPLAKFEAEDRLQFGKTFRRVAERTLDELQIGLKFLERSPLPSARSAGDAAEPAGVVGSGRAAILAEERARLLNWRESQRLGRLMRKAMRKRK